MKDTLNRVSAAAIQLLLEIGPIGVRTNPEPTKKSIKIFHIDPWEKEKNGEIAIEIVLFPTEEIIYWFEGEQVHETKWIYFIDTLHG